MPRLAPVSTTRWRCPLPALLPFMARSEPAGTGHPTGIPTRGRRSMHHENRDLGMPQHAFGGTAENALAQAAVAVGAHHQAFRPGAAGLVEQALRDALAARRVGPGLGVDAKIGRASGREGVGTEV